MAEKTVEKKVDDKKKIGARTYTKQTHGWIDDKGEVHSDEDVAFLEFSKPSEGLAKFGNATVQNPDLLFWKPEVLVGEAGKQKTSTMNPIRGFVLAIFPRPEFMNVPNDDDKDGDQVSDTDGSVVEKMRLACFILTTAETYVSNREKEVFVVPPGTRVWVDLNQANVSVGKIAAPRYEGVNLVEAHEVGIEPHGKQAFTDRKKQPRFRWRMSVYGGHSKVAKREGFRTAGKEQIEVMGEKFLCPQIHNVESTALSLGLIKPKMIEAQIAGGQESLVLPENASAN